MVEFKDIYDVIDAYPEWKLMIRDGSQQLYVFRSFGGDTTYKTFVDRMQSNPSEVIFDTVPEGVNLMANDRAVLSIEEGTLKSHFKSDPYFNHEVKIFSRERPENQYIIFPKNSPLTSIFKTQLNKMYQDGVTDYLVKKWKGDHIPSPGNSDESTAKLSIGQTAAMFIIIAVALCLSGLVFILEFIFKKVINYKRSEGKQEKKKDIQKWINLKLTEVE